MSASASHTAASSSTTSTLSMGADVRRGKAEATGRSRPTGSRMVNVEANTLHRVHPDLSPVARDDTIGHRESEPRSRAPLVLKNGSKTRRRTSSDIPFPVSSTLIWTLSPSRRVAIPNPPVPQGIHGVQDEVRQDIAKFGSVAVDWRDLA